MGTENTRWLNDREQDLWRTIREFLWQFPSAMDRQLTQDSAMQSGEYSVLAVLSEAEESSLRPAEMAEELRWDRSRLSHLLRRMEAKSLITRCSDASDRRGHQIGLSELGWQAIREAAPKHVEFIRQTLFDSLTPAEHAALETALPKILAAIAPHAPTTPQCD
ncbi:MarR family transcriptional regulator [Arthrobacter sp. MYb211]|uniref:MarR family winged helix-turn-helix transcriptional regulator n=1 Tax=Micrococcaceae TaxID=1268 RepID=UPI000CFB422F|nr:MULTISPECIES: MarR family transcriptional regulator [unclassified Arthrobacter]PQZ96902.1 MarR family transcriptional regulator [Arthrobacter sp. MYb224]PRA08297.1 MarR family transcriptional regulator [Arthrobacter sp. MYb221]PRC02981.1 MarR family transcriptional regulator [Arthrobacter sp. MYb211]